MTNTEHLNLYKWEETDTKNDTIKEMAANSQKIDDEFKSHKEKLSGIDNSLNELDTSINELKPVVNEALSTANDLQGQLDAVIHRETDSDAMSRQAAINAEGVDKENLKNRLDDDFNKVTTQLADTSTKLGDLKEVITSNDIVQRKLMEAFFGFNNGTTNTSIFSGASNAPQGLAYLKLGNQEKVFVRVNTIGGSAWEGQRCRIVEFDLREDGSVVQPISYSQELNLGHQTIKAVMEDGQIYLYSSIPSSGDYVEKNVGKGLSKVKWRGNQTNQTDVTTYPLFGLAASKHIYEDYNAGSTAISSDGQFMLISGVTSTFGTKYIFIYDKQEVERATNSLDVLPVSVFLTVNPFVEDGHIMQDIACDGSYVYILRGQGFAFGSNALQIYNIQGDLIRTLYVDGSRAEYQLNELLDHPTLGNLVSNEPEGLDIRGDELLLLMSENWKIGGDTVTYKGQNYACATDGSNIIPSSGLDWVRTNKPANKGEWNASTVYSSGKNSRRSKVIYSVGVAKDLSSEKPINNGTSDAMMDANLYSGTDMMIAMKQNGKFNVNTYSERTGEIRNSIAKNTNQLFIHDEREGADNKKSFAVNVYYKDGRNYAEIRVDENVSKGAGINFYGKDDNSSAGKIILWASTGTSKQIIINPDGSLTPGTNNTQKLGDASARFSEVFAGTAAINTSDRNYKQRISSIPDNVLEAWSEVNYCQFKFNDAVERKGNEARWHIGLIAQDIKEVFERHGLDACDYGLICYDEWDYHEPVYSENGEIISREIEAGSMWSIRADECQFLEMALMRRELTRLKRG